jgi:hypothetical protein
MKPGFPLLAGWLSIQVLGAQTTVPTVEEILSRVQANTGQFEKSLPDFVCDEKVHSQRIEHGVVTHEAAAESHFTGLQRKSGRMSFTETREYVTIDGKPAAKSPRLSRVPLFGGGFSSLLDQTFSKRFAPLHDYRILGRERLGDRPALGIEFATKPGQDVLRMLFGKDDVRTQRDTGKAWIDEETLQVLRIERRFLNLPSSSAGMVATVDYGPVSIDGKPFWMPLRVKSEQTSKRGNQGEYTAEYTNYRKFDVASGIIYEPVP